MQVSLMLTCLCDALYGEVGIASARVLEHVGCTVQFDERQTCCGQPPFNAGDWGAAREIAARTIEIFSGGQRYIVTPSSSCAAMMRHGYRMLFPGRETLPVMEIGDFLWDVMSVRQWPLRGNVIGRPRTLAFHSACHNRVLHGRIEDTAGERLIGLLPGVRIVPVAPPEQCCGFGGAFSVNHPHTSAGIGIAKLQSLMESGAEEIVSGDMGCLMHLDGLIRRNRLPLKTRHYIELLAEAI
jgi:L-lactate dehydrogenase complex protein LldE